MAKMVQIQSSTTIKVTAGLQNIDVTNPEANIPDRLKVNPQWPKYQVLIREGAHLYPAEILAWNSVKALANDKIITIGATQDVSEDALDDNAKTALNAAIEAKNEFKLGEVSAEVEVKASVESGKKKTLELKDLA